MTFFDHFDAIYCINLKESTDRRQFMDGQFRKFGIQNRVQFLKAYNTQEPIVKDSIQNNLVYPILLSNVSQVAICYSFLEIWKDIFKNKHTMALILEDDVAFTKNCLEIGQMTISKGKFVEAGLDPDMEPYVVHLIGNNLVGRDQSVEPKIYDDVGVKYGNAGYVTNYHTCRLLLKNFYPIKCPSDDFLSQVKHNFRIEERYILPLMIYQVSNEVYGQFNKQNVKFKRLSTTNYLFDYVLENGHNDFLIHMTGPVDKVNGYVYEKITGRKPTIVNETDQSFYMCGGGHKRLWDNSIVVGASLVNSKLIGEPLFISSVRGKRSHDRIVARTISCPEVYGDMAQLLPRFYKPDIKPIHKFATYGFQHPDYPLIRFKNVEQFIDDLHRCECVISKDALPIIIAHAYSIKAMWLHYPKTLKEIRDYYSAFDMDPEPVKMDQIPEDYPQPSFPIKTDEFYLSLPFNNRKKGQLLKYYYKNRRHRLTEYQEKLISC